MTAAPGFTPGPWEYVEDLGSRVVADGIAFSAPYRLHYGSGYCKRQDADNRLIAAAPDGYAVCAALDEWDRSYPKGTIYNATEQGAGEAKLDAIIEAARAMLAKARGTETEQRKAGRT